MTNEPGIVIEADQDQAVDAVPHQVTGMAKFERRVIVRKREQWRVIGGEQGFL